MKKVLLSIFLICCTAISWGQGTSVPTQYDGDSWINTDYNTTEGTDFWVTFLSSGGNQGQDANNLKIRIFATARQYANVWVYYADGSSDRFVVPAMRRYVKELDLNKSYILLGETVESKGVHVVSDRPISLYAVSQNPVVGSQDGTNVYPTKALGRGYIIQTYGSDKWSTEFALVATKNNTTVNLEIHKTYDVDVFGENVNYPNSIIDTTITLPQAGMVYLYRSKQAEYSLSGTKICSDKPIAVFQGGQEAAIPFFGTSNSNHIYSQAMPIDMWGKKIVATSTKYQKQNYFRLTALENQTLITRDANPLTTISVSETYQDTLKSISENDVGVLYSSASPFVVNTYLTDAILNGDSTWNNRFNRWDVSSSNFGSPAMSPIIPIELGMRSVVFTTLKADNIQYHYVNIVTYQATKEQMQLRDSVGANKQLNFFDLPNTPYSYALVEINDGAYVLQNNNRGINGVFTAYVYGMGSNGNKMESYAYSAGSRIERSIDMLIDGQYIKEKDVCIPNRTVFTPIINHDYDSYHWEFIPTDSYASSITTSNYTSISDYGIHLPDTGKWEVNLVVNYTTPASFDLCRHTYTDTVKGIIHMHDTIHVDKGYNDKFERNICYGDSFYVHYERGTRYDYVADPDITQHILGVDTKFEFNKQYVFKDTIENQWGCDSIIWQHVIIRPQRDTTIYDTICVDELTSARQYINSSFLDSHGNRLKITITLSQEEVNQLVRTEEGYALPIYKEDSVNLTTRYNCDSVVHLKLTILPIYRITDPSHTECADLNESFAWYIDENHKHTDDAGRVLAGHNIFIKNHSTGKTTHLSVGDIISKKNHGVFTLIDSLKTQGCTSCGTTPYPGCDSVHTMVLTINEQKQVPLDELHLCDNDTVVALNDTLCVGYKYTGEIPEPWKSENRYIVINKTVVLSNHTETTDSLQCDSLTTQRVILCNTKDTVLPIVPLCQTVTSYEWRREDNNQLIKHIDFPLQNHYPFDTVFTDTLTSHGGCGCDSILHLPITIYPVYDTTTTVILCEKEMPYLWELRDKQGNHDKNIALPATKKGTTWSHTEEFTLTTQVGCDSVVHLDLTVYPTVTSEVSIQLCPDQLPYVYCEETGASVPVGFTGGDKQETFQSTQFPLACDSVVTYHIAISDEIRTVIDTFVCNNELPYNHPTENTHLTGLTETSIYYDTIRHVGLCDSILELHLEVHYQTLNDTTVYICAGDSYDDPDTQESHYWDTTYVKTLTNAALCDSIVTMHIVRCDTFNIPVVEDTICETALDWSWHISDSYGTYTVNVPIRDLKQVPLDTLLTYILHTVCPSKCDSVVHLRRVIKPVLRDTVPISLCPEKVPYIYGVHGKTASETGIYRDTTISVQYGCDSITTYDIVVSDEIRTVIDTFVCNNELPYNHPTENTHLTGLTETSIYYDTIRHVGLCDSILELHLEVHYQTLNDTTVYICAGDSYDDPDTQESHYRDTTYVKTLTNAALCDSIVTMHIVRCDTFNLPVVEDTLCETLSDWSWHISDSYGTYIVDVPIRDLEQVPLDTLLTYTLHTVCPSKCDSVVHLHRVVKPILYDTMPVNLCPEKTPYTYGVHGKTASETGIYRDTTISVQYGCDSITTYDIVVNDEIRTVIDTFVCNNELPYSHPTENTHLTGLTETNIYYDTIRHTGVCDSILELHLEVRYQTTKDTTVYICAGDSYDDLDTQESHYRDTTYVKTLTNAALCDSIVTMHIVRCDTFNLPVVEDTLCETASDWSWHISDSYGTYMVDVPIRDLEQVPLDTLLTYTLHTVCPSKCDSVVHLHRVVKPVLRETINPVECPENLPYQSNPNGKLAYTTSVYNDTLVSTQYGCDSILTVNLTVLEKIITPIYLDTCDNEVPYNHPTENTCLQGLITTGIYYDTLQSHVSGCDSIIELHLSVWPTYEHSQYDTICDNGSFDFHGHVFEHIAAQNEPYTLDSVLTTIHGCDSLIHFYLTVHPTYAYLQDTVVCQDTVHTQWTWTDEFGGTHGNINISIAKAGDYIYADTLHTIYGCDSVFGIRIHVPAIYRFDSTYVICQDERIEWQGRGYSGDNYGWSTEQLNGNRHDEHRDSIYHHYHTGDSILPPGIYYDTVHYFTSEGCDSIFYLKLIVNSAGHFVEDAHACDKDSFYVFETEDSGILYRDTVFFFPITRMLDATRKDTAYFERERAIHTANGCDKTIHYHLTVHPTYEYVEKVKICPDETYEWRGKTYANTGVYYDSLRTDHWGCDSVYVLELFRRPLKQVFKHDTICDNETYVQFDTVWYDEKRFGIFETVIWRPGEPRGDSARVVVRTFDNKCDSIIYHYLLQINKTYIYFDTAAICSNESYETETHVYTGYEHEYDVDNYIAPYDTVVKNEYLTQTGCDSVYHLKATIYPVYRHRDTITVCDNESATWRGHQYSGVTAGEYVFYDSLKTREHDCDSIYELYLVVHPTYLFEERTAKCADEDMTWHAINMDHLLPGEYFYFDSLQTSTFGCDSVYHLYLTVNDTTREERYDTICRTETYDFHGVPLTEPGYYYDTTLNELGCHHFTHLFLEVIEPTVPTAWTDSICADDEAYDLFYTYTGDLDPIAYSLYYDEEGHLNGFEDIENQPITTPDELSWLRIPMPRVDEDRTKYPKPNFYNIKLVLDNGICTYPDLCSTDTTVVLSYPSWITQQRFGDVIALYNEKYNGGYQWSAYQWFHGDSLMEGETFEYLYVPTGLVVGDQYHVRLTREGETTDFQTCPITIVADPINNDYAPTMGYLSVTPTCVCPCSPYINILSRKDGTYRITAAGGSLVREGVFRADVTKVEIPTTDGFYMVQLWSPDTPEEPHRVFKVLVSPKCPNYENMPF